MTEALNQVREDSLRAHPNVKEPMKRVLVTTMQALAERVERMGTEQAHTTNELRADMAALTAKLDVLVDMVGGGRGRRSNRSFGRRAGSVERPPPNRRNKQASPRDDGRSVFGNIMSHFSPAVIQATTDAEASSASLSPSLVVQASSHMHPLSVAKLATGDAEVSDDSDSSAGLAGAPAAAPHLEA